MGVAALGLATSDLKEIAAHDPPRPLWPTCTL